MSNKKNTDFATDLAEIVRDVIKEAVKVLLGIGKWIVSKNDSEDDKQSEDIFYKRMKKTRIKY